MWKKDQEALLCLDSEVKKELSKPPDRAFADLIMLCNQQHQGHGATRKGRHRENCKQLPGRINSPDRNRKHFLTTRKGLWGTSFICEGDLVMATP